MLGFERLGHDRAHPAAELLRADLVPQGLGGFERGGARHAGDGARLQPEMPTEEGEAGGGASFGRRAFHAAMVGLRAGRHKGAVPGLVSFQPPA